ncbi:unnamed protein product [Absidia cylindrospora]
MGTPDSKHLPEWFAFEPVPVREHLVAGLVDSDGHVARPTQEDVWALAVSLYRWKRDEKAELVTDNDNGFNQAKHLYFQDIAKIAKAFGLSGHQQHVLVENWKSIVV